MEGFCVRPTIPQGREENGSVAEVDGTTGRGPPVNTLRVTLRPMELQIFARRCCRPNGRSRFNERGKGIKN
jgi:hypothetical protein